MSPFPGLVQYETRARLERLAASSSISSADLFDEQKKQPAGEWGAGGRQPDSVSVVSVARIRFL